MVDRVRVRSALLMFVVAEVFAAAGIYVCLLAHQRGVGFNLMATILFILICLGIAVLIGVFIATIWLIVRWTAVLKVVLMIVLLLVDLAAILWVICWFRGAHAINVEWPYALPFLAGILLLAVAALPSHRKAST